jgi:hypothetical protein
MSINIFMNEKKNEMHHFLIAMNLVNVQCSMLCIYIRKNSFADDSFYFLFLYFVLCVSFLAWISCICCYVLVFSHFTLQKTIFGLLIRTCVFVPNLLFQVIDSKEWHSFRLFYAGHCNFYLFISFIQDWITQYISLSSTTRFYHRF